MNAALLILAGLAQAAGQEAAPPPPEETRAPEVDNELIDGRRRPGYEAPLPDAVTQDKPGALRAPPPQAFPDTVGLPVPDRWRLVEARGLNEMVIGRCSAPGTGAAGAAADAIRERRAAATIICLGRHSARSSR